MARLKLPWQNAAMAICAITRLKTIWTSMICSSMSITAWLRRPVCSWSFFTSVRPDIERRSWQSW